jgi:hypothetical protein
MQVKIGRLTTRPPFWIPEVSVAVRSSRPYAVMPKNANIYGRSAVIRNPGLEPAVKLVGQMKAAAEGKGDFSKIMMPNGRKLSECTFGYSEIGEAMVIMGLAATRNF